MIRFSAALVVVGLGLLLAGAITSNMTLVYTAIAVSVCAALVLAAGAILGRDQLFGRGATAEEAERTYERGITPGPGTAAISREAADMGLRSLGSRDLAAASTPAGPPGPSYTGVGWPGGRSPADELWARVDAELAAAGASPSASGPKLTKESSSDEIWGRVEEELSTPGQRNTRLVIPAAEETGSAEPEPAAEAAGRPAWAEPATDAADHTEQLVVIGRTDAYPADGAGAPEASTATAQDANDAQPLAPAGNPAVDEAAVNRWTLKPARDREASIREASEQEAGTETTPDRAEAARDVDEAAPGNNGAGPGHTEAVLDRDSATPGRAEAAPDADGAAPGHAEGALDADGAAPGHDEGAPDNDGAAPRHDEVALDADGAAPGHDEGGPDSDGAATGHAEAVLDRDGAAPEGDGAAPDRAEAVNDTRPPDEDADPADAAPVASAAGEHAGDPPAAASPHDQAPEASSAEPAAPPASDPGPELLAAPPAADTSLSPGVPVGQGSPAAPELPPTLRSLAALQALGHPQPPGNPQAPGDLPSAAAPGWPEPGRPAGPGREPGRVIVVSGVPRYHQPGCILIRFLSEDDVESVTREAAEASGCVPCRACQPDKLPSSAAESGATG